MAISLVSPQSAAAWYRPVTAVAPVQSNSAAATSSKDGDGDTDGDSTDVKAAPSPGTGKLIDISA